MTKEQTGSMQQYSHTRALPIIQTHASALEAEARIQSGMYYSYSTASLHVSHVERLPDGGHTGIREWEGSRW